MKNLLFICIIQFVCGVAFTQGPPPADPELSVPYEKGTVYEVIDEQAEFPGGMLALRKFLTDNLKYPERPLKDSVSGKCYLKLLISDIGEVKNVMIIKGVENYPEFGEEALRVMYLMPQCKPAKVNGKNVNSFYRIPVSFK